MVFTLIKAFVALLSLSSSVFSVHTYGYLGKYCSGEELYYYNPDDGVCVDVSAIEGAQSIVAVDFGVHETVTFYSDTACSPSTNGVGGVDSDVCYLVPEEAGVRSFMTFKT